MRQIRGIPGLIWRNARSVQAALPFSGFLDLAKPGFAKHLVEITEIEGGAVLPITENEIGEPAAERIEVTGKSIVEPIAALLSIGSDRTLQARNDEPDAAAVFHNADTFPQQLLEFIGIKV